MKIAQVLNEYRRGDADTRMSLCLYYRELRDEFGVVELNDPMDLETTRQASSPPERSMCRQLLSRTSTRS